MPQDQEQCEDEWMDDGLEPALLGRCRFSGVAKTLVDSVEDVSSRKVDDHAK